MLENNGVGPAFIKSFTVKLDGAVVSGYGYDPLEEVIEVILHGLRRKEYFSYVGSGYALGVGEKRRMIDIRFLDCNAPDEEAMREKLKRIDVIIEYENLYGKMFRYSSYEELAMRSS
ncbi:hypothetical protein [Marinobacterium nitratireducens]|uniref:hypothetical protein n=1 Tax=Marinobacterium nitratireducens TaxID=518897 RepID=UPI00166676A0|nr:hypothetical protein [Marinobacterium nitratireducens]